MTIALKNVLIGALFLVPAATGASIPPPMSLLVISQDREVQALNRAYVQKLIEGANFLMTDSIVQRPEVAACLMVGDGLVDCVRAKMTARAINRQAPPVVVIVTKGKGDIHHWRCVGVNSAKAGTHSQTVALNLKAAFFGKDKMKEAMRSNAMGCLFSAATEAEGIIRQ